MDRQTDREKILPPWAPDRAKKCQYLSLHEMFPGPESWQCDDCGDSQETTVTIPRKTENQKVSWHTMLSQ